MIDRSDPVKRTMYLFEEVRAALLDGTSEAQKARMMLLRADLESWVKGDVISMCFRPYKAHDAYLGLLDPPREAIWDIRSRENRPSLRVLGMFAKVNTFVALDWWPKRVMLPWSNKEPLGDDDLRWRLAMHEVRDRWHNTLPGEVPVAGTDVRKYVTGNVDVRI